MAGRRATGLPQRLYVEGVAVRHQRHCPSLGRGAPACACRPSFQAQVWSARDRKTIRKTFPTVTEALTWRQEAKVSVHTGRLRASSPTTLAEAAEEWLERAEAGVVRTR